MIGLRSAVAACLVVVVSACAPAGDEPQPDVVLTLHPFATPRERCLLALDIYATGLTERVEPSSKRGIFHIYLRQPGNLVHAAGLARRLERSPGVLAADSAATMIIAEDDHGRDPAGGVGALDGAGLCE